MSLDLAPFNLMETIEDVAALVSVKAAEKDLEIIVRVDPCLVKMFNGDEGRIRQVVTNLLGNAVKFTEKGHVYVNVEGRIDNQDSKEIAKIKLSVTDTGIGIPEEDCEKIFEEFSQVDGSATRKHEGTGLGLSIVSSLIKLMNGEVGVNSALGEGSTFWVTMELPVEGQVKDEAEFEPDMKGARILVVDDNHVNRSILTEKMTSWQFDGAAAASGDEGLRVLRSATEAGIKIDAVILDYQMPEMSGADVLRTIRTEPSIRNTPVIMLTSVDTASANDELKELSPDAVLSKPTRSSVLLETITKTIMDGRPTDREMLTKQTNVGSSISPAQTSRGINDHSKHPIEKVFKPTLKANIAEPVEHVLRYPDKPLEVLIAEDNEVNQTVLRQILDMTGYNYMLAENGRAVLDIYERYRPLVICMDVSM
ncbi:MAG: ATP-binding protein, partial [Pseudomonadota bacterium]